MSSGGKIRYPEWTCKCPTWRGNMVYGSKAVCYKCGAHRPALPSAIRAVNSATKPAQERRPGDWDCPSCPETFIFSSKKMCPKCQTAKPANATSAYARQPDDWDCTGCGKDFIFAKHATCPACGRVKPAKDTEVVSPDASTCCICLTNKPIMMARPCNHKHYCFECAANLYNKPCALCKKPITTFERVYD